MGEEIRDMGEITITIKVQAHRPEFATREYLEEDIIDHLGNWDICAEVVRDKEV